MQTAQKTQREKPHIFDTGLSNYANVLLKKTIFQSNRAVKELRKSEVMKSVADQYQSLATIQTLNKR